MTSKIGLGILLVMTASAASASSRDSGCSQPLPAFLSFLSFILPPTNCSGSGGGDIKHVNAPEIDPSSAMAGLTLLGAGLTVLSARRKSK